MSAMRFTIGDLQGFATKSDIREVKEEIGEVKLSIEKAKLSEVVWILTGLWGPLILAGAVWFFRH